MALRITTMHSVRLAVAIMMQQKTYSSGLVPYQ